MSVTSLIALRWAAEASVSGRHESHRDTIYNVGEKRAVAIFDTSILYPSSKLLCFNGPYAFWPTKSSHVRLPESVV